MKIKLTLLAILTAGLCLVSNTHAAIGDPVALVDSSDEIVVDATLDAASVAKIKEAEDAGGAKRLKIMQAKPADLGPLVEALPNVEVLELFQCTLEDLAPLTKLANLKELSVYGSTLKDFSPLAGCAKLRFVKFGKTKGADYATLGKLAQVERFEAASQSEMTDIVWVENLPNLKWMNLAYEKISDFTPLAKTKIEELQLQYASSVDIKQLGGAATLQKLHLIALNDAVGFEALAHLVNLKELILSGVNKKDGTVDVAFLKNLANLQKLEIIGETNVVNFEAVAACEKLTSVNLTKAKGITSLAPLKKLPALKTVTVSKDAFNAEELAGFNEKVKVNVR